MIHHYADSLVAKGPSDIIRNFKITNNCLANIIASSDETTFWTAADTVNDKALIIAQVKAAGAPSQFYMLKGIPLCPPPTTPPCDTLFSMNDF